jgi:hypothetical protein
MHLQYLLNGFKVKESVEVWTLNADDHFEQGTSPTMQTVYVAMNVLAFSRPTFDMRKPDVAIYIKDRAGRLGVALIGDIKSSVAHIPGHGIQFIAL